MTDISSKIKLSGVLNINKPANITSHDVVKQVRRLTQTRKVGHAGTLDPIATGVLLVCLGSATRLIEYLMSETKVYRATVRFGQTTNTYDSEGEITSESDPSHLSKADIEQLLPNFVGHVSQVPPVYSALKRQGVPLYKLARQGIVVTPEPRQIYIHDIEPIRWQLPEVVLDITCQAGTYIRSLAHDLGQLLNVGAHLTHLIRLQSGPWLIDQAVTLKALSDHCEAGTLDRVLQPKEQAVTALPHTYLDTQKVQAVRYGQRISPPANFSLPANDEQAIAGYNEDGYLVAILKTSSDGLLKPKKVF